MKNQKLITGMVLGGAIVIGVAYLLNHRKKNGATAKVGNGNGNGEEKTSGVIEVNPCGSKLGQPCGENQGGDWITGTYCAKGRAGSRSCECCRQAVQGTRGTSVGANIYSPTRATRVRRGRLARPTVSTGWRF